MQGRHRYLAPILAAMALIGTAQADTYTAMGFWDKPFTGADELREQGHTVQVLYVDNTQRIAGVLGSGFSFDVMPSEQEIEARKAEVLPLLKEQLAKDAFTNDVATRKLAVKLGLKRLPAIIERSTQKARVIYDLTDLSKAVEQFQRSVQ